MFLRQRLMMFAFRNVMVVAFFLVALAAGAFAASDWLTGGTDEKLKTLAGIQPGLGTVMIEYSNRYSDMYYAAKSGNWPLVAYQLKEALEIQEVGETTRPARADALKAFEQSFLDPIGKAIQAKDFEQFDTAFRQVSKAATGAMPPWGSPTSTTNFQAAPPPHSR